MAVNTMKDLFGYEPPERLKHARKLRDLGMGQAIDHADRTTPAWRDMAFEFLVSFAKHHQLFISEDVSDASKEEALAQPPTDRAWGSVYIKALKFGVIAREGTGRSRRRHASICPRWRSRIYEGEVRKWP